MKRCIRAAAVSAILLGVLGVLLLSFGLSVGSSSLVAGAIMALVRSLNGVAIYLGIKLSRRHPADFPSGLYKLENLAATLTGLLILAGSYVIARYAVREILGEGTFIDLRYPAYTFIFMSMSMVVAVILARYKGKVGREENSPSLSADARHSLIDGVALIAIGAGVALESAGVPDMDAVAALVVVAFLAWTGVRVTLDGLKVLLDASVDKGIKEKVKNIAEADPRVGGVLSVEGHNSGRYCFLSLSLPFFTRDLREAEEITLDIKERIRGEIENVDRINVDFTVDKGKSALFAVPLAEDGSSLFPGFGDAPSFAFVEIEAGGKRENRRETLANPFLDSLRWREARLVVFLARRGVELLMTGENMGDSEACAVLEENGIEVLVRPGVEKAEDAEREISSHVSTAAAGMPDLEGTKTK